MAMYTEAEAIQATENANDSQIASWPHMEKRDRNRLWRRWLARIRGHRTVTRNEKTKLTGPNPAMGVGGGVVVPGAPRK